MNRLSFSRQPVGKEFKCVCIKLCDFFSKNWAPFIPIGKICHRPNLIYTPFNFSIVTFEGLDCPPVFGYIVSWRVSWAYLSKLNPTATKQWIVQRFPTTICLSVCSPTPLSWSIDIVIICLSPTPVSWSIDIVGVLRHQSTKPHFSYFTVRKYYTGYF